MCGSAPKPQAPPPPVTPPVVPTQANKKAQIAGAVDNEKQKAMAATGQGKTVLTSPLGVQEDPNVKKKSLLGA